VVSSTILLHLYIFNNKNFNCLFTLLLNVSYMKKALHQVFLSVSDIVSNSVNNNHRYMKKNLLLSFLLLLSACLLGLNVNAQYTYTTETFENAVWPASDPGSTPVSYASTTGTWKAGKVTKNTTIFKNGAQALNETSTSFQLITPALNSGVGVISFWGYENGTSNRTIVVKASTDGGTTFPTTVFTTANISQNAWTQYTSSAINSSTYNCLQFTVTGGSGVILDDILITANCTGSTTAPTITSTTLCAAGTTVSGTSTEANGTAITVYKGGTTSLGSTTVSGGAWSATVTALTAADVVTAIATKTGSCPSSASSSVTVQSVSATPVVTTGICTGATSVSGTSTEANGTTVTVYKGGTSIGTTTVSTSAWSLMQQ
jgi:hypothetical protein